MSPRSLPHRWEPTAGDWAWVTSFDPDPKHGWKSRPTTWQVRLFLERAVYCFYEIIMENVLQRGQNLLYFRCQVIYSQHEWRGNQPRRPKEWKSPKKIHRRKQTKILKNAKGLVKERKRYSSVKGRRCSNYFKNTVTRKCRNWSRDRNQSSRK